MHSTITPARTCFDPGIPHLMWIFLNNAFLSIVSDKGNPDNLLVRARRHGDIQRIFPRAKVAITPEADYRYRARVPRTLVAEKIASQIAGIDYTNFTASVTDESRQMGYRPVWRQMFIWQGLMVEKLRPAPSPAVMVEKLRPTAPPPVTAKAGKKPRRKRWSLFGGWAR
jgi:hypothetical protein